MNNLCIIPARGGSKRIPRKNIRDFLGKPILAYSIEAALNSRLFNEVIVSTEDEEISIIAQRNGALVPFMRSSANASDYAGTSEVLLEVLEMYMKLGKEFDYVCCIYPTAPFVNSDLLQTSYKHLLSGEFDSVFPVLPFSFPIQRALRLDDKNKINMFQPEHLLSRSQDLEKAYHDAGQFYFFNPRAFLKNRRLYTDNTSVIILKEMQAHDIDSIDDWEIAEFKYQLRNYGS